MTRFTDTDDGYKPTPEEFDDPNSPYGPNWQRFADEQNRQHRVFEDTMPGKADQLILEMIATKGFHSPSEALAQIIGHMVARLAAFQDPTIAAQFCRELATEVQSLDDPPPPMSEELHRLARAIPLGCA